MCSHWHSNIRNYIKSYIKWIRFCVPHITTLKTAFENISYISKTTIYSIKSIFHIVYINITITNSLTFFGVKKKFLVQFFVKLTICKTSLCCNQRTICISIAYVTNVSKCLTFLIYFIKNIYKVNLIITIISISLCHLWVYSIKCIFNNNVHFIDWYFVFFFSSIINKIQDIYFIIVCKMIHCPLCWLFDSIDYLLWIKRLFSTVFFNYLHNITPYPFPLQI